MRRLRIVLEMALLGGVCVAQTHVFPATDSANVFTGTNQFTLGILSGPVAASGLAALTPVDGTLIIVSDGTAGSNPCVGGGTGAIGVRISGAWSCGVGGGGTVSNLTAPTGFPVTGNGTSTVGFSMPAGWNTGSLLLGDGINSAANLAIGTGCLTGNGTTASWGSCAATGGTVTGTGTTNTIPKWTSSSALGNSSISDSGGTVAITNKVQILSTTAQPALLTNNAPTSCSGSGTTFNAALFPPACRGIGTLINPPAATTGAIAGLYGSLQTAATLSGTPALAGVYGEVETISNGSPNYVAGVAGFAAAEGGSGTIANLAGVVGLGTQGNAVQSATLILGVDGQVQNNASSTTAPLGAALYARSPSFTSPITNIYGLYVADQTVGGGTNNPNPHGIYVGGGGIQTAAHAFSTLPACSGALEGRMEAVTDSSTATWGATITGGGANHVLAYCNGTNWDVMAK